MSDPASKDQPSNQPSTNGAQSGSAAPAALIVLPKGGGAIKGMGEKFAANPVTGTGSTSVPIDTSPGRSGFGPSMSLSYDSGSGNSAFGFGWSLAVPSISRKTDKALPRYFDEIDSDVFMLAGSEDLVPTLVQNSSGNWLPEVVPPKIVNSSTYLIRRYRPRLEGLYSLIERWTNKADANDVSWRTISKNNVCTWFGRSAESRIVDPSEPRHIFSWLICESHDDKGNVMVYGYKAEDSANVNKDAGGNNVSRPCECNRNNQIRSAQRYLKHVRYGNAAPYFPALQASVPWPTPPDATAADASKSWLFEVVFDYGEHDANNPLPTDNGLWSVRPDPFSSYRAGFEVRTYRKCKRVLMFHHFPDEAGVGSHCLVRSTDFSYSDTVNPADVSNPIYSFLISVSNAGYRRTTAGTGYTTKSLPPVQFDYSVPVVQNKVENVDPDSLDNLPVGINGMDNSARTDAGSYRLVDLHGEGTPGILTEQGSAWHYKRNQSPLPQMQTDGTTLAQARFAAHELVAQKPNVALMDGADFVDLGGDGQPNVVVRGGTNPGYYGHDDEEGWLPFVAFQSQVNRNLQDPNMRMLDLDGDGLADLLITEDDALVWHASLAREGFGPAVRVSRALDEEAGVRAVFADVTQSLFLADMSGDGLTDIVRIRNGEICYWPNLGFGRFGAKITMDHAPVFDAPDLFRAERLRLADIDGSGTVDMIYLHADGVQLYFNQSGNGWSQVKMLPVFPRVDDLKNIITCDLLGNGTACLVWSSSLPGDAQSQMRYVKLMGDAKPHLLIRTINNLGAEMQIQYAPSTMFYLQDKRDGKPWITKLPFPVHVVERVTSFDHVSRNRYVTRYAYHHGYYDRPEREFRGFGMVEQFDSEAYEDYVVGVKHVEGGQELAPELYQPTVTSRSWFHTGACLANDRIIHQFRHEYFQQSHLLPDPDMPAGLSADDFRESLRALKGVPLRQEIYSFDGSTYQDIPYTVSENTFEVHVVQPRGQQLFGVYQTVGRESIAINYERSLADPRVSHTFSLELDEYGHVLKSCSVVYGRRVSDPSLPVNVTADQQRSYISYNETDFTQDLQTTGPVDAYRLRVTCESRGYEITGISPGATYFERKEIATQIAASLPINYEVVADGVSKQKRFLMQTRTLFCDNSLNPLPLGQWDTLGLASQSFSLALTPGVVSAQYAGNVSDAELSTAGYVHFNGDSNWWSPSGTPVYPTNPSLNFYIPTGSTDPLGLETDFVFDKYVLLHQQVQIKQANWSITTAQNDYRVLGPVLVTNPNGNRNAVEADELGMVIKTAVMGKVGSTDGDTLADPSTRLEYDVFNWLNNGKPNFVHTFAREQHGAANPRWQETYAYSNGGGSVAMVKAQAHPGNAFTVQPDGTRVEVVANPRWVGNGRTVLNNKGNAVKQYDPYFSTTSDYEDEKTLRQIGVTPIYYYDAIGRKIRTAFPNGTFNSVQFTPWLQKIYDANDNVLHSQWYVDRGSPDPTLPEPINDPERRAAWLAAKHSNTPNVVHLDSLGRRIYAIADYGSGQTGAVRSNCDLTGRSLELYDQNDRLVANSFAAMNGIAMLTGSAEKGKRWLFKDILGALVKTWDEFGRKVRTEYDVLHRPVSSFVQEKGQSEILIHYIVYGDRLGVATAKPLNLLGATHLVFEQGGMLRVPSIDFKGTPRSADRILASDYKNAIDWKILATQPDVPSILSAAIPLLDSAEVFTASGLYDALNRPTEVTLPDGTIVVPTYNESNMPQTINAQIRGMGSSIEYLQSQDYDANGQRQFALHGNNIYTRYFYDQQTFRLTELVSYPSGADPTTSALQDLNYYYDPVGNVTQMEDNAQQTNYFNNAVVKPENLYEYDALYQLIRATGRELAGGVNNDVRANTALDSAQLPNPNNASAVRNYSEEYQYDLVGNLKTFKHRYPAQVGAGSGWTRNYRYAFDDSPGDRTNRLTATTMPGQADPNAYSGTYTYDNYGNMASMPHLATMEWNFTDQLKYVDLGGGGKAYYVYGQGGQRTRKVIERTGNLKLEWIFLGPVKIFRRRTLNTNDLRFERSTVTISDNAGPIAQIDTKTLDKDNLEPANPLAVPLTRYQYGNRLGSASIETDALGTVISYEEYHPFGTSAYRSSKSGVDLSLKRYRFSGKELDDETGLYYFGARYLAPWLGRWTSSDPAGLKDGFNLFCYCRNNPVMLHDPTGMESDPKKLNPSGEVTTWTKGTQWVYSKGGARLSESDITQNFTKYANDSGHRFTPGTLTWEWEKRNGVDVPVFNAEWLDAQGKPLLPRQGEFGYVAPMRKQDKATYGTPGVKSTRLDENEHGTPNAQNKAIDPTYDNKAYKNDDTVKSPRGVSLDKTRGDNARSEVIKDKAANGQPINVTEEIDLPSNQEFHRANDAAKANGDPHIDNPGSINRGMLNQTGNRSERGKSGSLPTGSEIEEPDIRPTAPPRPPSLPGLGSRIGNFAGNTAGTLARNLIPGFAEAEMGAVAAPYLVSSLGITNGVIAGTAAAAAAAPTAAAAVVVASAVGGYVVGGYVGAIVTDATGSRAAGVAAGTLAGAGTGALIGAAIGSIVPGLGTAAGAIIGGVVGGVAGFIGSYWN